MAHRYHIAQFNLAAQRHPIDHPGMADFVAQLDEINALAEQSPGFVWRLKDDSGNATAMRPAGADMLINMSVWESIDALFAYTYKSDHVRVFRERGRWFERSDEPQLVLWWTPAGEIPSAEEGVRRLEHLRAHGPSPHAFTLKARFDPPEDAATEATQTIPAR